MFTTWVSLISSQCFSNLFGPFLAKKILRLTLSQPWTSDLRCARPTHSSVPVRPLLWVFWGGCLVVFLYVYLLVKVSLVVVVAKSVAFIFLLALISFNLSLLAGYSHICWLWWSMDVTAKHWIRNLYCVWELELNFLPNPPLLLCNPILKSNIAVFSPQYGKGKVNYVQEPRQKNLLPLLVG